MDANRPPAPGSAGLPVRVRYSDQTAPLAIEATIVTWPTRDAAGGTTRALGGRLDDGVLYDADKGHFPIAGLEFTLLVSPDGSLASGTVVNPGGLSEFQQEWLLDAVCSALKSGAGHDMERR